MLNNKGYTIIELLVVMVIFIVVIMISTTAFETLLKKSGQQGKSAEGDIAGIVGLEMMRADITHAGYGLPWSFQSTPGLAFAEVSVTPGSNPGIDATTFNELLDNPPKAITGGVSTTTGIDYLVVKSTMAGMNPTARKWSYMIYSEVGGANTSYIKNTNSPDPAWANADRAIIIDPAFTTSGGVSKQLVMNGATFFYKFPDVLASSFKPTDPTKSYLVYGIGAADPSMPYNRVDFYVDKSTPKPASCNSGTGVLSKAVAKNDQSGGYVIYPLLDCVGDMQIIYDRDTNNDGKIGRFDHTAINSIASLKADEIRGQIKNVRVYILAHEGKKDPGFTYPGATITVGEFGLGTTWTQVGMAATFGADWKNYRWKVYTFAVNLKDL